MTDGISDGQKKVGFWIGLIAGVIAILGMFVAAVSYFVSVETRIGQLEAQMGIFVAAPALKSQAGSKFRQQSSVTNSNSSNSPSSAKAATNGSSSAEQVCANLAYRLADSYKGNNAYVTVNLEHLIKRLGCEK